MPKVPKMPKMPKVASLHLSFHTILLASHTASVIDLYKRSTRGNNKRLR